MSNLKNADTILELMMANRSCQDYLLRKRLLTLDKDKDLSVIKDYCQSLEMVSELLLYCAKDKERYMDSCIKDFLKNK